MNPVRRPIPAGRYAAVTSRRDGGKKYVDIGPGQTLVLGHLTGAGRIVRLWMTLPLLGQRHVLKDAVLKMYWDGEHSPSVEAPLGDFFGASFGRPRRLVSERLVIDGGAYLCRFVMPFNDGAMIELENQSQRKLRMLFFQIGYLAEPPRTDDLEPTFHARFIREAPTRPGTPVVLLKTTGGGWFAGARLDIQNRSWWLKPPLRQIPLPRGFGLGLLEGWETMIIDGENRISGTGAEDYFSGGFYFLGAPYCTPTHGCTRRSFFTGRVSAYRFHVDDPIPFRDSFELHLDHGLENSMEGDYAGVVYWYQYEPHPPFVQLPEMAARRVRPPWKNVAQWLILLALPVLAVCVAFALVWASRPR